MKRVFCLSLAAAVAWVVPAAAAPFGCHKCDDHCKEIPEVDCPCCKEPCQGHHHCSAHKSEHAHKLLQDLCDGNCCTRIKAAKKLGHRLHANFCCDCEILPGLVKALFCDPCWEVRKAAAWSIAMQGARTRFGVMALYVSSKLDPHYMVRDKAAEALDILLLCCRPCYKDLFAYSDDLIKQLRKDQVKPGSCTCDAILGSLEGPHGGGEVIVPDGVVVPSGPERLMVPPMPGGGAPPAAPMPGAPAAPPAVQAPPAVPAPMPSVELKPEGK